MSRTLSSLGHPPLPQSQTNVEVPIGCARSVYASFHLGLVGLLFFVFAAALNAVFYCRANAVSFRLQAEGLAAAGFVFGFVPLAAIGASFPLVDRIRGGPTRTIALWLIPTLGQVTLVGGVLFYERDLWWVALPSALGFGVVLARARGGALASLPAGRALSLGFAMAVALVGLVRMQFADARWSLNGVRVLLVGAAAVSVLVGLAYLAGAGISGLRERKLVRSAATIQWLAYGGACSTSYVFTLHRGGYLFASLLLLYLGLLVVLIVVDTDWCLRRPGRWLLLTGAPVIFACGAVTLHLPRQDLETRFGPYSTDSLIGLAAYLVSVPQDSDRDGYYLQRVGGNDCNDAEPMTHPGGKEPCEARSYDAKAHFSESRAIANLIVFVFDAVRGTELSRPENLRRYPFCTA